MTSRNATKKFIELLSDSDEEIPAPSGLTVKKKKPLTSSSLSNTKTASSHQSSIATTTTTSKTPPKKKQKTASKPTKGYSLIWICTHGKGRSKNWRKKDLKIMGIYPTKAAAEQAKQDVMSEHECYGHGDICVGDTWEDEIDLLIREAPLHL